MINQATVKLRNITLGVGRPKIAVPITGKTADEIGEQAQKIVTVKPDVVEWRIDYFDGVLDAGQLTQTGQQLRQILGDIALLTTFRTKGEGGELALADDGYFKVCETVLQGHFTDALDIERFHDETAVKGLVGEAHEENVVVIMSNHDFDKTPAADEIQSRLTGMVELGADVAKMAVMPHNANDVLTLLTATTKTAASVNQPLITMSMGDLGKVSRIAGETFGSALTFATVGAASAPGQIPLQNLRQELEDLKLN
ncbi:3-dehydroquinate dehydratase I [Furfurilactobacillus rossiae]|nr:type I 3-dehydroquinate dehydratase [Furfurilactobacillus rossiae]MCF6166062.1 type I 3-dehydroquinate dehydratase [Furfurilactobacillus rossiae]QLE63039.1 3-dehydroquinate dehydratase I [Furfurilactobacillus rossiae]